MPKNQNLLTRYRKVISSIQKKYLIQLSSLSLLLIFTTVLANHRNIHKYDYSTVHLKTKVKGVSAASVPQGLPQVPVLNEEVIYPALTAQSVIVLDMDSGIPLYEKNPNARFLPASTTKIMTAIVAMEYYDLQQEIVVERFSVSGQKMNLLPGEKIRVEDLIYGLLIYSANDAAEVLARNYPGGREMFIAEMNKKANELNLSNTNFENPSGFDGFEHYSTARDLVTVASYAMKDPLFSEVVSTRTKIVTDVSGEIIHNLRNTNELLGQVEGVLGVKTGWTENARENLVTYINREGRNIMIAVMGSQDRFGETRTLTEWVFSNYNWVKINDYSP